MRHGERHRTESIGWLRAAVLGANDGLLSTSSLVVGVAAAGAERPAVLLAALAGTAAGSLSMAAGEYVSVSSQGDTEKADLAREREELATQPEAELEELAGIYQQRGLTPDLALQVAKQLTEKDALTAHAREELGIHELTRAKPFQAAVSSAAAFAMGAAPPVIMAAFLPLGRIGPVLGVLSIALLGLLGGAAARMGGAPLARGALRMMFWGAAAMVITSLLGRFFGGVG
jgi:VIT1/CCC1 family predicted Fe2+/Mn2+ transporter